MTRPTFFPTPARLGRWLQRHHDSATELWVGFYKKNSGKTGMTYHEALDEALCFGWIDGLKKRVDDVSYMHRFSPRKPASNWSAANVRHVERLMAAGRMHPSGLAAFERRDRAKPKATPARQREAPIRDSAEGERVLQVEGRPVKKRARKRR